MSGRTLDDFFEDAAAFSALSDEDKTLLMAGGVLEGETDPAATAASEESSEAPAAANVEPPPEDLPTPTPEPTPEPVILAKDGQHTIPFSELEAARERTRQLEQELQALKAAKPADPPPATDGPAQDDAAPPAVNEQLAALVEERDNALYAGDTERAKTLSLQIIGIQNELATQAALAAMEAKEAGRQAQAQQRSAYEHGLQRVNELVGQYAFLDSTSPNANQDAIDLVVAQRDRLMASGVAFAEAIEQAVAKVAPLFDKGNATRPPEAAVAQKAAEAISKAKAQVPTSLSQVPAGAAAHHDEGEAMRSKSGLNLLNAFEGKSSEEILKQLSRVI